MCPKIASRPPGRSTCAAFTAPDSWSTQCQAWAAITVSNVRPPGCQASNVATSTRSPRTVANSAIRASGSPEHVAPGGLELAGRDAGTAADVESARPGAPGDELCHQRLRVAGSGRVVAVRVRTERLGHPAALCSVARERDGRSGLTSRAVTDEAGCGEGV